MRFFRYKEEEFLKQVRESGHVERSLREEVRSAHDQLALIISSNKKLPVDDLGELYKKQRDMQKKVNKLKQVGCSVMIKFCLVKYLMKIYSFVKHLVIRFIFYV